MRLEGRFNVPGRRRRSVRIAGVVFGVLSAVLLVTSGLNGMNLEHKESSHGGTASTLYVSHTPIYIIGNSGFTAEDGVVGGSGTASDPYVIEGWEISEPSADGIRIESTDAYFIVRNCHVHDGIYGISGIYLHNCTNGILTDNNCTGNGKAGISLFYSDANTIVNNTCFDNFWEEILGVGSSNNTIANNTLIGYTGIFLSDESSNNTVINNECWSATECIVLKESSRNTVASNNLRSDHGDCVWIWWSSNNTVMDNGCNSNGLGFGINLLAADDSTVVNNDCTDNSEGIYLGFSSGNHIANNTCSGNRWAGIWLDDSSSNTVVNNACLNNTYGIYLEYSDGTFLSGNMMNGCGLLIEGDDLSHWNTHEIDTSNRANGKPIYYCRDQNGMILPGGAGQVILANCTDFVIGDQNLSSTTVGVLLGFSSSVLLTNNDCSNNQEAGVWLYRSSRNTIADNNCSNNKGDGILLDQSSNNTIIQNQLRDDIWYGVSIDSGSSNLVWNNAFYRNNGAGDNSDPSHIQAYDGGTDNRWNSTTGYGNYWSDYNGVDANGDGIGDTPYVIDSDSQDRYPLMKENSEQNTLVSYIWLLPHVVFSGDRTSIIMVVYDKSGNPVDGAEVALASTVSGWLSSVENPGNGRYTALFEAAQTTLETTGMISATVAKSGYLSGNARANLVVLPYPSILRPVLVVPTYFSGQFQDGNLRLTDSERFMVLCAGNIIWYFYNQSFGTVGIKFQIYWATLDMGDSSFYPDWPPWDGDYYSPPAAYANNVISAIPEVVWRPYSALVALQDNSLRSVPFRECAWMGVHVGFRISVACLRYDSDWRVASHELGHAVFGFGDFYSDGLGITAGEVYYWCLMGNGNDANPPSDLFSVNKISAGWLHRSIYTISPFSDTAFELASYSELTEGFAVPVIGTVQIAFIPTPPYVVTFHVFYFLEAREKYYSYGGDIVTWNNDAPGVVVYKQSYLFARNPIGYTEAIVTESERVDGKIQSLHATLDDSTKTWFDAGTCLRFEYLGDSSNDGHFNPKVKVGYSLIGKSNMIGVSIAAIDISVISENGSSLKSTSVNETFADLDLHARDQNGGHVGMNYTTGTYENTISGAIASGNQIGREFVLVPKGTAVDFEIRTTGMQGLEMNYTTTVIETGADPRAIESNGTVQLLDWSFSEAVMRTIGMNQVRTDVDDDNISFFEELQQGTDPNEGPVLSPFLNISLTSNISTLMPGRETQIFVKVVAGDIPIDGADFGIDASLGNVSGIYGLDSGTYVIHLALSDNASGKTIILNFTVSSFGFLNGTMTLSLLVESIPVASFVCSSTFGDVSMVFEFNASSSWDLENPSDTLEVRWDFDGDGTWDTDWTTEKTAQWQYSVAGNYTVRLEVRDTQGLTNNTTMQIEIWEVIPEFPTVVVPVLFLLFLVAVVARSRLRQNKRKMPG